MSDLKDSKAAVLIRNSLDFKANFTMSYLVYLCLLLVRSSHSVHLHSPPLLQISNPVGSVLFLLYLTTPQAVHSSALPACWIKFLGSILKVELHHGAIVTPNIHAEYLCRHIQAAGVVYLVRYTLAWLGNLDAQSAEQLTESRFEDPKFVERVRV